MFSLSSPIQFLAPKNKYFARLEEMKDGEG